MLLLNYAHPLTADQCAQLAALTGQPIAEVRDIPTQLNPVSACGRQITALIAAAGLAPEQWRTTPLIVVPPPLNFAAGLWMLNLQCNLAAALLLWELRQRIGHLPPVARLRSVVGAVPLRYEVGEVVTLDLDDLERQWRSYNALYDLEPLHRLGW